MAQAANERRFRENRSIRTTTLSERLFFHGGQLVNFDKVVTSSRFETSRCIIQDVSQASVRVSTAQNFHPQAHMAEPLSTRLPQGSMWQDHECSLKLRSSEKRHQNIKSGKTSMPP